MVVHGNLQTIIMSVSAKIQDAINRYTIEYDDGRQQYKTDVEARDIESAKFQFLRDNPDFEILACYFSLSSVQPESFGKKTQAHGRAD